MHLRSLSVCQVTPSSLSLNSNTLNTPLNISVHFSSLSVCQVTPSSPRPLTLLSLSSSHLDISIYLSFLSIYVSIFLSIYLSIYVSIYVSIYLSIFIFICRFINRTLRKLTSCIQFFRLIYLSIELSLHFNKKDSCQ